MRWVVESVIVLFGTLIAAALVAWGGPGGADLAVVEAVRPGPEGNALSDWLSSVLQRAGSVTGGDPAGR